MTVTASAAVERGVGVTRAHARDLRRVSVTISWRLDPDAVVRSVILDNQASVLSRARSAVESTSLSHTRGLTRQAARYIPPASRRRPSGEPANAPVAELVDALDSKSSSARSAGSIPARGTKTHFPDLQISFWSTPILLDCQPIRLGAVSSFKFKANVERHMKEPGLDSRHRDKNGEISKKHGNTLVSSLRKIYGATFAAGQPGTPTDGRASGPERNVFEPTGA